MNLPADVSGRMEYIQKLFLDVEQATEKISDLNGIKTLLEQEPPEFRSIAYESASMTIAARDLSHIKTINHWIQFRQSCSTSHTFHIDIGLGWAFARTDMEPINFIGSMNPAVKRMVFDGFGYYYGLFKGRNTVKNKIIPEGIEAEKTNGFDQGLGRRLWYMAKGNVNDLRHLLQGFNEARQPDLWRGIGIACGYVGGNKEETLEHLSYVAGSYERQLGTGIKLAFISRIASGSVNEDVKMAYRMICKETIDEMNINAEMSNKFFYLYLNDNNCDWLSEL